MPKIVNYVDRFDDLRRAVCSIALRDGATAITLPAVAAEAVLSVSTVRRLLPGAAHLPELGCQLLDRRARERLNVAVPDEFPGGSAEVRARNMVLRELPSTPERAEDARVRRILTLGFPHQVWAASATTGQQLLVAALADRAVPPELPEEEHSFEVLRLAALIVGVTESVIIGALAPEECLSVVRRHLGMLVTAWENPQQTGAA